MSGYSDPDLWKDEFLSLPRPFTGERFSLSVLLPERLDADFLKGDEYVLPLSILAVVLRSSGFLCKMSSINWASSSSCFLYWLTSLSRNSLTDLFFFFNAGPFWNFNSDSVAPTLLPVELRSESLLSFSYSARNGFARCYL